MYTDGVEVVGVGSGRVLCSRGGGDKDGDGTG